MGVFVGDQFGDKGSCIGIVVGFIIGDTGDAHGIESCCQSLRLGEAGAAGIQPFRPFHHAGAKTPTVRNALSAYAFC